MQFYTFYLNVFELMNPNFCTDHRGCINLNRKIVATKIQNGANQTVVNCTALGLPHCQECRICEENYCNGAIGGYEYGRTTLVVIVMIGLAMMMY